MRCRHVRKRMVPFQDGELAPSEVQQVQEHLDRCAACRHQEQRLARVTPQARLVVPPEIQARLAARVEGSVLRAIAAERPPPPRAIFPRLWAWLRRDAEIPLAAVLAYGALLALAMAWGLSNWWTVGTLEARLASSPPPRIDAHDPIPAEQYRPAAWSPEAEAPSSSGSSGQVTHPD